MIWFWWMMKYASHASHPFDFSVSLPAALLGPGLWSKFNYWFIQWERWFSKVSSVWRFLLKDSSSLTSLQCFTVHRAKTTQSTKHNSFKEKSFICHISKFQDTQTRKCVRAEPVTTQIHTCTAHTTTVPWQKKWLWPVWNKLNSDVLSKTHTQCIAHL